MVPILLWHELQVLDLGIVWESPAYVVVNNWKKAVALYCLPNVHPERSYVWKMIGSNEAFVSTPFIYVNKAGMYQCVVKFQSEKLVGKIIDVSVHVGKCV